MTTSAARKTPTTAKRRASGFASAAASAKAVAKSKAPRGTRHAPSPALAERASNHTVALNPLVGVRPRDMLSATGSVVGKLARSPRVVTKQTARLARECARIIGGHSDLAPPKGDRRFADDAWTKSPVYRRLMQSYLAFGQALDRVVDEAHLDPLSTERARFATSLLVDAVAPTNFVVGNPAALRKLRSTKGASVIRGFANLVEDLTSGTGLPRQVDVRPFELGKNIAATPGAVVYRNELLELIQYAPATAEVYARPLVIVPPQINKFYAFDLAPDKSLVGWARDSGVQTFAVSWRNPTKSHADSGFDAYTEALEQAIDAMRAITGSVDVNAMAACSGGITLSALLGNLAARRACKVHSATIAVCLLDVQAAAGTTAGLFATPAAIAAAKAASRKRSVVEGRDLARMFAWMRPNDLVWNYVVNNYLLGNDPPAHDILFWNNDTTRLPARLHADFLDLFTSHGFTRPGTLKVRGRRVDLSRLGIATYVVAGLTDHITPWQGVYRTARLLGGARCTFALSNGGHIQSLINPPGNPRSWFITGTARSQTPDAWYAKGEKTAGSWWPHWRTWIQSRSGRLQAATPVPGDPRHPALAPAPGTYVLER